VSTSCDVERRGYDRTNWHGRFDRTKYDAPVLDMTAQCVPIDAPVSGCARFSGRREGRQTFSGDLSASSVH